MNVVVRDHHGGKHRVRVELDRRANQFFRRNGGAKIVHLDAVFLDAAVLDVDDLPQPHRVLVLADGAADNAHWSLLDCLSQFIIAE
ncbi:hypothetical protein SDC9_73168 [bioreactor metagenome]|uniref:Uncharacterized protein n=1 Tax=bioreactor metagenome TaxID=1076179 RepID=A0A644YKL9_9ZZZZ